MKTIPRVMARWSVFAMLSFAASRVAAEPPSTYYDLPRSPYSLSRVFGPYETEFYRVENFGFYFNSINEYHPVFLYPTYADVNPAGQFMQLFDARAGDFNGDGWQDLIINFTLSPHTIEKAADVRPVILLNDRKGGLYYDPTIWDGLPPTRKFTTRVLVADFNGDGVDDYVETGFGLLTRLPDGTSKATPEPIPLVLSQPGGRLVDATRRIEGQENGGPAPGWNLAHDLAIGDVDGDGTIDIYQGGFLFLNDGRGNFRNARARLPAQVRFPESFGFASAVGDLNNDGFADIILTYNDVDAKTGKGYGYIALSTGGKSLLDNPTLVRLPAGLYGTNTKPNYAGIRDLDGDGRPDIVIAQTRATPYYEGRVLQLLMNRGSGVFVDETSSRIDNSLRFGSETKQGNIGEFGEGEFTFVDVNGDGFIDIVDQNSLFPTTLPAITIFLNDGRGHFTVASAFNLPFVPPHAVSGFEPSQSFSPARFLPRAVPINLDKQNGIDFVSFVLTPGTSVNGASEMSFYTIRSLKPLVVASVPPVIVTQPAGQAIGAFGSAKLSVVATGSPPPTYQWKFNGADLPGQNDATLFVPAVGPTRNGTYTVVVSNASGSVTSAPAVISADPQPVAFINLHPISQAVNAGADVTFTAGTNGTATQWYFNDEVIPGATTTTLTVRNVQLANGGVYLMEATRGASTIRSNPARLSVMSPIDRPQIVQQPASATITPRGMLALVTGAVGTLPLAYQWRKDGAVIPGGTTPVLLLTNTTNADAGAYTCTVTNTLGSVVTRAADVARFDPARIINLSILTDVTASSPTFTVGTVLGGAGTAGNKPLLIRAAGPSLAPLGVTNSLSDPRLDVFAGSGLATANDDWGGSAALLGVATQVGAFAFTSPTSHDAAVAFSPVSGAYTVQVSGVGGATGNVIAELYDATPPGTFAPDTPRLINVSVLKQIGAGSQLTAGFVIGGSGPKQVVIRAIGPTLGAAPFNVPGVMNDPRIDLFNSASQVVASNDNWGGDATLAAAFATVAAFALPPASRDAAILARLQPGSYTAAVSGVGGAGGVALVEVYEIP